MEFLGGSALPFSVMSGIRRDLLAGSILAFMCRELEFLRWNFVGGSCLLPTFLQKDFLGLSGFFGWKFPSFPRPSKGCF